MTAKIQSNKHFRDKDAPEIIELFFLKYWRVKGFYRIGEYIKWQFSHKIEMIIFKI